MAQNENRFSWKLKDVLMVAILGVLFSFLYLGTVYLGMAITTALTPLGWGQAGYEPFYGILFMAASLTVFIIQKPGTGIVAEVIAAILEVLMGNWFGPGVILTGLIQGAAVELVFLATRYRRFDIQTMILSAVSVGVLSFLYHFWESQFYLYPLHISLVMLVVRTISSVIFTGVIATLIGRGLAKTGILKSYPLGQQLAGAESLEVDG